MLEGIGVATCGELAALTRESVEVRLGPEGVDLWFLARADDPDVPVRLTPTGLDPRLRDKVWTSLEAARWWTGEPSIRRGAERLSPAR